MANGDEYKEEVLSALEKRFSPEEAKTGLVGSLEDLAVVLARKIDILDTANRATHSACMSLLDGKAPDIDEDAPGGELSMLLYHLHYPSDDIQAELNKSEALKKIWDVMAEIAPGSLFDPEKLSNLQTFLTESDKVFCNKWGDIWGFRTYEQLDLGWRWALINDLKNHLHYNLKEQHGKHLFVEKDWSKPPNLQALDKGKTITLAIIGDWGSGEYKLKDFNNPKGPAVAVMETMKKAKIQPDYLIHLGDTYYAGTGAKRSPVNEEKQNLVDLLKRYPTLAQKGRCMTLNSNHEMYGGAYGYFLDALPDALFSMQKGCSYFAFEFGDYIIAGIDSAYYDPSVFYMQGGLGDDKVQLKFLNNLAKSGKKIILLSHHTGMETGGDAPSKYLWNDVTNSKKGALKPAYWYWGHTHLGIAYNKKSIAGKAGVISRCLGHSSMPFASPPGLEDNPDYVDWFSSTPLNADDALLNISFEQSCRAKNGFATLTIGPKGVTEKFYEVDNLKPVKVIST